MIFMTEELTSYKCNNCLRQLTENQKICSHCGSSSRAINKSFSDEVGLRDNLRLKEFTQGLKSFVVHLKQGWFQSDNTNKHPDGVQLTQLIDRRNNLYKKNVVDEKTGSVVKNLEETLDKHR